MRLRVFLQRQFESKKLHRKGTWPPKLQKAAQAGVLKAQPKAKFILHLSQWNKVDYCIPFWQAMLAAEVQLDYPGLSYFPTSAKEPAQRRFNFLRAQVGKIVEVLHKPLLICETGCCRIPSQAL